MMQINEDIYPSVYGATLTAEDDRVEWSYPINYLNFLDNLPFGEPWDGSNSYIGFDPTINDCYVGAAKHTVMRINPEDKKQATIENTTYRKKINYRLLMMESNGQLRYSPIAASYPVAWTNIVSPWFSKFTESAQSITYYNVIAESSGTASLYSAALSNFGTYSSYAYAPITKINTDAILLVPQFRYITLIPTYDADGNITNFNTGISWLPYYQLKPEDESAAGQYYDSELWENGFKDTIDAETGRITQRVLIAGARINDVYYGVNTRNGFGSLSSSLWSDINLRSGVSRVGLNIIAEYYDEDRESVIYEYPNGVFFSSGSDSILYPITPWYQFYGNTMVAYARMNPNDRGYYSSSMDNSGLMCDNNTNNLVKSNTIVLPSNFVSLDEDGSRFEIHNNVNYYYLNSDGTSSVYSSYLSSGRQYYSYSISAPCFPLKDLIATIASFGFFFTDGYTSVTSYVLDDPTTYDNHLYRGNFDENGVSDGTWWQGDDIPEDKLDDIDYVPEVPGGGGGTDDGTDSGGDDIRTPDLTNTRIGAANNFVTLYGMTAATVADFGQKMWASLSDAAFWQMVGTAFTNDFSINPADMMKYFISLRYFPFDLADFAHTTAAGVYIGRAATPIAPSIGVVYPIRITNNVVQVDGGRLTISRFYNDFRDYEPCTTVQIHVPFCGSVDVPASEVMGHEIDLTYKIDLQTGAMLAVLGVTSNTYYVLATLAGTCGASIPITANNNIEFLQRIATVGSGIIGGGVSGAVKGATVGGEVGAVVGAVAGTVGGGVGALAGLPPVTVHKQGNASGFANLVGVPYAYATVQRGRFERPANYGHTTGFACDFSATLDSLSGFTVCDNVDTSGLTCNARERDEIKRLLESGVYV